MTDLSTIASGPALITAFATVIGGGALAFWMKYATTITIAAKDANEAKRDAAEAKAKSTVSESRINQQDTIITEIRTRMAKLDRVDELVASAKFIEEKLSKIVPREEQEQRFARLEADVREIKEHLHT